MSQRELLQQIVARTGMTPRQASQTLCTIYGSLGCVLELDIVPVGGPGPKDDPVANPPGPRQDLYIVPVGGPGPHGANFGGGPVEGDIVPVGGPGPKGVPQPGGPVEGDIVPVGGPGPKGVPLPGAPVEGDIVPVGGPGPKGVPLAAGAGKSATAAADVDWVSGAYRYGRPCEPGDPSKLVAYIQQSAGLSSYAQAAAALALVLNQFLALGEDAGLRAAFDYPRPSAG